jgi:hypothetical protein
MKHDRRTLVIGAILGLFGIGLIWCLKDAQAHRASNTGGPLHIQIIGQVSTSTISHVDYREGRDRFYVLNSDIEAPSSSGDLLLEASNNSSSAVRVTAFSTNFWWPRIEIMGTNGWELVTTRFSTEYGHDVILQPGQSMQIGCPALPYRNWRVGFHCTELPSPPSRSRLQWFLAHFGISQRRGAAEREPRPFIAYSPLIMDHDGGAMGSSFTEPLRRANRRQP